MSIAYFLHVEGPAGKHEAHQAWAEEVFAPALQGSGPPGCIELYAPQAAEDPYLDLKHEADKLLIVQADFANRAQLEEAIAEPAVADALAAIPGGQDFKVTAEAMTVRHFPLRDGSTPVRRAPLSFVVRYYPPIEEPGGFNSHYVGHHPPIMANFPGVRNILCYFPVEWRDASGIAPSNSFLGNELVFDSIADLNAALSSDVRHELREDYYNFPPHEGHNSHHAMLRRVICGD